MLLLIKSAFNLLVLALSITTLSIVLTFVRNTEGLKLASAPKAMLNLQEIFLPPLVNLQVFIFVFDVLVAIYYTYNFPVWDKFKSRFVYFQYETKAVEKQDCSNLFLQTLFILLSKVSPQILTRPLGSRPGHLSVPPAARGRGAQEDTRGLPVHCGWR